VAREPNFAEEVALFQAAQTALSLACGRQPTHPTCLFYQLPDMHYFRLINTQGFAPALDLAGQDNLGD
jgi:hypothetical protein